MCLVELKGSPKPVASCAWGVRDCRPGPNGELPTVSTKSPMVKKAREGVMEFLLINHPLDCPICDQGGECDLQDQAMAYGFGRSRYQENKRAVLDKNFGPLVKTIMTRCIHCTRCVRFATEVAGVEELGATGRGEHMEIGTYVEKALSSELSGNIIDLCPVGALTSKPYAFMARPWELKKTESIDVLDAVGSNIRVDARGNEVMRVLPRLNEDINEEWISDKTRFACDGLRRQRLDRPYVRRNGKLEPATWPEAFAAIAARLKGVPGERIAAIAGDLADVEAMLALKDLMAALGSTNLDCRQDGAAIDTRVPAAYRFNTTIAGIDEADVCLLIGTNPRWEAPIINARLRKRFLTGKLRIGVIGPQLDLTYKYEYLGGGPRTLQEVAEGRHAFAELLRKAQKPMLILGSGALARADGAAVLHLARQVAESCNMVQEGWNGFNLLHRVASRVGGIEIGFLPGEGGRDIHGILDGAQKGAIEAVYLLGADEIGASWLGSAFVIYQGHHGDAGAHRADVILPGAAYTEKNATYVNTEGRVQQTRLAAFAPGDAREDWTILRALSDALGQRLPYDNAAQLQRRMFAVNPRLQQLDSVAPAAWGEFGTPGPVGDAPFVPPIDNFYMTDPISRASETMAKCTETYVLGRQQKTGTHG
jgi:NADH-quinone oxidoreductase subunit G